MGKKKGQKRFIKLRTLLNGYPPIAEEYFTIYMDGKLNSDTPPKVRCTCDWSYGPNENMLELALEAKKHENENHGHNRRWSS